ncbi:hypothetical protein QE152_g23206 [Popillia japonica]|uniref:Uncharacterized protein n=1 Tax=Popillia japonica TaxID=7064 RepID=A0AAW1KJE5_POPJA
MCPSLTNAKSSASLLCGKYRSEIVALTNAKSSASLLCGKYRSEIVDLTRCYDQTCTNKRNNFENVEGYR